MIPPKPAYDLPGTLLAAFSYESCGSGRGCVARGRWQVFGFGAETFWLNLMNAAFGIATGVAIVAFLAVTVREIAERLRGAESGRRN